MNEDEAEAVAEEETEELAPADGDDDDLGRLVEPNEAVEDRDERIIDIEAGPKAEVTEAVTEPEVEEVSSPGSEVSVDSPSSSSVIVELGISSPSVIVISLSSLDVETGVSSSSSEDVELGLGVGVMIADGMSTTMEVTPLELELAAAEDDIIKDDCVVEVVVVGPMEVLLPEMRFR